MHFVALAESLSYPEPIQEWEYEQSKYNQKHEEGYKVVGQGKEGNEEFDRVIQMRVYD